ncbi:MAG TPA: hypothetical protein EYQ73_06245 [Candidatus Poseidoniales archaeon]|nr:hypothetical protein [Candidatus Poseidoniales archaeon]HIL66033.1 hypothetical protein [Candidatus Poseidoniales archaeon]
MQRRVSAIILVFLMGISPLVPLASADSSIGLSSDISHVILSPGQATNLTLSIHNNGSSIESYNVSVSGAPSAWEVIPTESVVNNAFPTWTKNTTIAIRLGTNATPDDSGTVTITVTEPDANISTDLVILLSVMPRYLPAIDASQTGDNGLVDMAPGDSFNLSIEVRNDGNVNDTILVSVDQSPDLVGFWANWTSGQNNSNSSGNNTGNNTNNTGNGTGNNTNNTGNGTGNNTGGNNTGNGTGNNTTIMMSGPTGWEVRFIDDSLDNMTAAEVRLTILRVTIPANENPGYFGFDLFAASALGNFSVQSTLVINVTSVHDLSLSHQVGADLLPGANTTSLIMINPLSTADANWTWEISVLSGNCSASLPVTNSRVVSSVNTTTEVLIESPSSAYSGDECKFSFDGVLDQDHSITESLEFTLIVGQAWGLDMILPGDISLEVDVSKDILILLMNNGTETDDLLLTADDVEGMTITTPGPLTLDRGQSQYVTVSLQADSTLSGIIALSFNLSSANSAGSSIMDSMNVDVGEFGQFTLSGPSDNRVILTPGQTTNLSLTLDNTGSADLSLSVSTQGLPAGVILIFDQDTYLLNTSESVQAMLSFVAANDLTPSQINFSITFKNGASSQTLVLDMIVENRHGISLSSANDRIIASPLADQTLEVMVTNLGTSQSTFTLEMDSSASSQWFSSSIDALSVTLDAGQSQTLTITVRETSAGASSSGVILALSITSNADSQTVDSLNITLIPQIADGTITVMSDDDDAKPGQVIYGNVVITNTGTGTDQMMITTLEMDCGIDTVVELAPSASSLPITWSCVIPEGASAGADIITFRLTSSARTDLVITEIEAYMVEPVWSTSGVVSFVISDVDFNMDMRDDKKVMVRVCNEANAQISGTVETTGKNSLRMGAQFSHTGKEDLNNTFVLSSMGCQDFNLLLISNELDGYDAEISIRAVTQIEGATVNDESNSILITVEGPHVAPDGLNFGAVELSNKDSITALAAGWILVILLLTFIKLRRPVEKLDEEEDEEEEIPLGVNEVRIDDENKVTCCGCETLLGVPRGSEPPFKFTCPKCDSKIRVVN